MLHQGSREENTMWTYLEGDCRRWQLDGIPCHHAIACCRSERMDPEELVHSCYTIETYKEVYAFTMVPLRGREHWEKVQGVFVNPPLYIKVMGRPKKNRKKTPEEKKDEGYKYMTKAGVTMYYSICGKPDHNKRGHHNYEREQANDPSLQEDDQEIDIPEILQVCTIFMFGQHKHIS